MTAAQQGSSRPIPDYPQAGAATAAAATAAAATAAAATAAVADLFVPLLLVVVEIMLLQPTEERLALPAPLLLANRCGNSGPVRLPCSVQAAVRSSAASITAAAAAGAAGAGAAASRNASSSGVVEAALAMKRSSQGSWKFLKHVVLQVLYSGMWPTGLVRGVPAAAPNHCSDTMIHMMKPPSNKLYAAAEHYAVVAGWS